MKTFFGSAIILAAMSAPVLAHPDNHSYSFVQSLVHLVTEPDHLSILALAAAGAAWLVARSRKRGT